MTGNITSLDINLQEALLVFALATEAAGEFEGYDLLITGVGKVMAAYELTRRITIQKPKLIINLGSAGSNTFKKGDVVCCTRFVQRDMDASGLGFAKFETPFSGIPPVLGYGLALDGLPVAVCGSGDSFEMAHNAAAYNVIDMEGYALAYVAMKEKIPFLCLKYISDGADDTAADDWSVEVHRAAIAFKRILSR